MKFLLLNEKNLAKQYLFWLALIIPILLFFFFGFPVWKNYTPGLNTLAYENFLNVSKLPLYLLGLSVPLLAIISYMHRTIQVEKQIESVLTQIKITEDKNRTDSYYSHLKSVVESLASLPVNKVTHKQDSTEDFELNQPHTLYKKIFYKSNMKDGFSIEHNTAFIAEISSHFEEIEKSLIKAKGEKINPLSDVTLLSLKEIDSRINSICECLFLKYSPSNHLYYATSHSYKLVTSFSNEEKLIETLKLLHSKTIRIFDHLNIESDSLNINQNGNAIFDEFITGSECDFYKHVMNPIHTRRGEKLGVLIDTSGD